MSDIQKTRPFCEQSFKGNAGTWGGVMVPVVCKNYPKWGYRFWSACDINAADPAGKRFSLRRFQRVFVAADKLPAAYRGNNIFVVVFIGLRVEDNLCTGYPVVAVAPWERCNVKKNGTPPFCLLLNAGDIQTPDPFVCPMKCEDAFLVKATSVAFTGMMATVIIRMEADVAA